MTIDVQSCETLHRALGLAVRPTTLEALTDEQPCVIAMVRIGSGLPRMVDTEKARLLSETGLRSTEPLQGAGQNGISSSRSSPKPPPLLLVRPQSLPPPDEPPEDEPPLRPQSSPPDEPPERLPPP